MELAQLDQLARCQHGVVHRDQTGLSRSSWYRLIRSGTIIQVHPDVSRFVGAEITERQRITAATLAVPGSIASHRSAAMLWDLVRANRDGQSEVHLVTVAGTQQRRSLDGVTCHRPRDRQDVRAVHRSCIPVTPPLRTLVDLGITDPQLVHSAVGAALRTGLVTIEGIEVGLRRHSEHGRHGVVALRRALDDWAIDARPADSVLEPAFVELCERHGLPRPDFHAWIEGWEVDFRFPGTPIVIECDGWTTHGRQRDQFERDRRKDDDLRSAGWIPARFTYRAITGQQRDTARRLRRLLDRWGSTSSPDA